MPPSKPEEAEDRLDLGSLYHETGNVRDAEDDGEDEEDDGPGFGDNSEDKPDDLDTYDALKQLHNSVINRLLQTIKDGSASEKDYANAIKVLKDNGMVLGYGANSDPNERDGSNASKSADLPDLPDPAYRDI